MQIRGRFSSRLSGSSAPESEVDSVRNSRDFGTW